MPRDKPARNPRLNPAGLPPEEAALHVHVRPLPRAAAPGAEEPSRCRFVSSWGGTRHCREEPYLEGFCRFHHRCLVNGEISPLGRILDRVQDQARRREINLHGIDLPEYDRLEEDPLSGAGAAND